MKQIVKNIGNLYGIGEKGKLNLRGTEMNEVSALANAWMKLENGNIAAVGSMSQFEAEEGVEVIDFEGDNCFPAFTDAHTHMVYAAPRDEEFRMRIEGASYEEVAAAGGGILNSVAKLRAMSEDQLFEEALARLKEAAQYGSLHFEIKSGYGLSLESELKMLRVIQRLKTVWPGIIKSTFLAAHAVPNEFKGDANGYLNAVIHEMLPQVAEQKLADYIDIFCEKGYFSADHTAQLLSAAAKLGLKGKIHVNQFNSIGGIQVAVEQNCLSVDHLEVMPKAEIEKLQNHSNIYPVALPGCSFFINIPYAPARKLIDANLPLVIASDANPGSTPSFNLFFAWSLACVKMKMTPNEAFNALTLNAAAAIEISEDTGSITPGKRADFIRVRKGNLSEYPYFYAHQHVKAVYALGKKIE